MIDGSKGKWLADLTMAVLLLCAALAVFRMWVFPIAGFVYLISRAGGRSPR